jgi:hypothetical protein
MIVRMAMKPKNPARPKVQQIRPKKRRRRARDPEIRDLARNCGERAAIAYRNAASPLSRRTRIIRAIDKDAEGKSALKRRYAAFGRKVLGPLAPDANRDEAGTLKKRFRRRYAILAQTARRVGLHGLKASKIEDPRFWRDDDR